MSRLLALFALIGSSAAAAWTGHGMIETLDRPAYALPEVAASDRAHPTSEGINPARPFLAIYGEPQPVVAEPQVAVAVAEPVKPFDFTLKGLIALGDTRWAVLSQNGVDVVVREGEVLEDGVEVIHVRAEGIELATEQGRMSLGFNSNTPVALTEIAPAATAPGTTGPKGNFNADAPTAVLFQDMSSDEIIAALEAAEEQRISRGWTTNSD